MKQEVDDPVPTDDSNADLENGQVQPSDEKPTAVDVCLVGWNGPDDPELPMNFPIWKKSLITCVFGTLTIWVTFSSSVFSAATTATFQEFHVSVEVMTLETSLTVLVCITKKNWEESQTTSANIYMEGLQWGR
jgi:hypothetical protein